MRSFLDPAVLNRLRPLPLKSRWPMLGNVAGKHRSPIRGSSVEFASYRKYVPGDDTRRLDWRAYGRSDRFYIKEFEADTNLRLCLVVDTSGSMNYAGAEGTSKLDFARRIAGTLAFLAAGQGDAVGLYCAANEFQTQIPPKRNASHLRHVFDQLESMKASGETGLIEALHEAAERIARRALVVVISDFFLQPDALSKCVQHLRFRKHDVAMFHLLDDLEVDFKFNGPVRFNDLESEDHILADPSMIVGTYRESMQRYLADVKQIVREGNVDYHRIMLNESYERVVARFLMGRK